MVSATFTGQIIARFEDALSAFAILTAYIPMLMDTGGNCGSQASVTVIRGISLDEIEFSDLFRVIWKEIRVAVICGATLAAANFVKLMLVDKMIFGNPITITVALVICLTLVVTVFAAKVVAVRCRCSPRRSLRPRGHASPFITTVVDAISLMIYFNFASLLLEFEKSEKAFPSRHLCVMMLYVWHCTIFKEAAVPCAAASSFSGGPSMEEKLREYAKLLIEVGLNVQKGQTLVISCPVDCAFFARLCASAAYDIGCREVVMRWSDDYLSRERFLRADDSVLTRSRSDRRNFSTATPPRAQRISASLLAIPRCCAAWTPTASRAQIAAMTRSPLSMTQ